LGAGQVLNEGAVDLDDVDAELSQTAERGEAGAEIVDGDAAAEILGARHKAPRLVEIMDRGGLGDLQDETPGDARMGAKLRLETRPPIGIGRGGRGQIEAGVKLRDRRELVERELQHAVVDEADEAET